MRRSAFLGLKVSLSWAPQGPCASASSILCSGCVCCPLKGFVRGPGGFQQVSSTACCRLQSFLVMVVLVKATLQKPDYVLCIPVSVI